MVATWSGYDFLVYDPHNTTWNDVSGIYIFTGLNLQVNRWVALYIGQADSFRNRIPWHEKWSPAVQLGATHVHAMVVEPEASRGEIERYLIGENQPSLNVQHRTPYVNPWSLLAESVYGLSY
jgi:excinuclease UvrABC nuclease subunit